MSTVYRLPSWLVLLACATLLNACSQGGPTDGIDPNDATQVALGKAVYARHCASCHGADLEGQPNWRSRLPNGRLPAPPHDHSGHTWHHSNADLIAMTRDGLLPPLAPKGYESDMPAYANVLSDDEILAALAFIQSTWPPEVWEVRRKMLEQAGR